jgi:hypothetical protein
MRRHLLIAMLCALLGLACSKPAPQEASPAPAEPAKPAVPAEILGAAQADLGEEAEVLAYDQLARNGNTHEQILVVNRLPKTPQGAVPGLLITRAVVLEKDAGQWKEVFRADEHLKNPQGYLGGTPISPVSGWRLQYEQHEDLGLVMYFTPIEKPAGGYQVTIGVRWNPKVKRYQSLDRNYEHFLGEVPSLGRVESQFHR